MSPEWPFVDFVICDFIKNCSPEYTRTSVHQHTLYNISFPESICKVILFLFPVFIFQFNFDSRFFSIVRLESIQNKFIQNFYLFFTEIWLTTLVINYLEIILLNWRLSSIGKRIPNRIEIKNCFFVLNEEKIPGFLSIKYSNRLKVFLLVNIKLIMIVIVTDSSLSFILDGYIWNHFGDHWNESKRIFILRFFFLENENDGSIKLELEKAS